MADTKVSALPSATPVLTDEFYLVDDPGGTPSSKRATLTSLSTLLAAASETLTNKALIAPKITRNVYTDADDYTITLSDQSGAVLMTSAGPNAVSINDFATEAIPVGAKVVVWSTGAGVTTIQAINSVTLQVDGSSTVNGSVDIQFQYGRAVLEHVSTDVWAVTGDVVAFARTSDIGTIIQGYDADTLKADTADQLTAGYTGAIYQGGTPGATYTPDPDNGQYQEINNDGSALEIQVPTIGTDDASNIMLYITNTGSPSGALTFASGYETPTGDSYATTNGAVFRASIHVFNIGASTYAEVDLKQIV